MFRLLSLSGALALASGQVRNNDALITWFGDASCNAQGAPRTLVVANQGFCQRVPNAQAFPGYRVTCDSSRTGSGVIDYCDDISEFSH